jgi:hypothetical protein
MTKISSSVDIWLFLPGRTRQTVGAGRYQADQRAQDDGQQDHERQVAAVGRDHPHVPAGQRGHLPEPATARRRRRGRELLSVGRLDRARPAEHVLGMSG